MSDYDSQSIDYPDYQIYLKNLQVLSSFDFSDFSYNQIYHKFHDLALVIPGLGAKLVQEKINGYEKRLKELRKRSTFEEAAKPLIKYLNENHHPHTTVIVTPINAELLEGCMGMRTLEFVKD